MGNPILKAILSDPAAAYGPRDLPFRLRVRWQYQGRRRLARLRPIAGWLPWAAWCALCAPDAASVVRELARRSDRPLGFLQIGSYDGRANDPLNEAVRDHRWSGVLVEPVPRAFDRLVATYEGVEGLRFANVAIGNRAGTVTIYSVQYRPGDPEWIEQIASLDRDVLLRHVFAAPDLESRIVAIEVECVPLPELVRRYGLERLDLLHIDAEGLDHEIIAQIDLDAPWAPRYLIFEKKHMRREQYLSVRGRLENAGYRFVRLWPDELAYRGDRARPGTRR